MEQKTIKSARVGYVDIYRGFGILLMLMGHIGFGEPFSHYIHAFHMPIFFFVSGYLTKCKKDERFLSFLGHTAQTLLIPYLVFVTLCQPLHYLYTHEFSFLYFLLSLVTSNHNRIDVAGAYWFLLCLFSCKVLFWLILKYSVSWYSLGLVLLFSGIGFFSGLRLPLCLDSACSMLLFMYAGFLLKKYESQRAIQKIYLLPVILVIVLLALDCVLIMLNGPVNIRCNHYATFLLFLPGSFLAVLGYFLLAKRADLMHNSCTNLLNLGLQYMGRNSLVFLVLNEIVIYVADVLFVKLLAPVLKRISQVDNIWTYSIKQVIVLCITICALCIITECFNRTKLKLLLGKWK